MSPCLAVEDGENLGMGKERLEPVRGLHYFADGLLILQTDFRQRIASDHTFPLQVRNGRSWPAEAHAFGAEGDV